VERDGIPLTGIKELDSLAIHSRSFAQKMAAIRRLGYETTADPMFPFRGEFDIDQRVFLYNPGTMTRLDLVHEWRHYKQLLRLEKQGLRFRSKGVAAAEVGAYRFEERLWNRMCVIPSAAYLKFHSQNLGEYIEDMLRQRRWLTFHPLHAEIFR
jgi:hypothetical protein